MTTINWDLVEKGLERDGHRMIWRPYGLPTVANPEYSAFFDGVVSPPWDVPDKLAVSAAITGAFFTPNENPNQPITVEAIRNEAMACAAAGASTVHIHVRDDAGYNVLSPERFAAVIEPLKEAYPGLAVDGCLVAALKGEWDAMLKVLDARLLDAVPINTAATYVGDALFAKPLPMILAKTRHILESGALPIIACYTDADVNNADRMLFRSGLMSRGATWLILPALPGCSPMMSPKQMFEGLLRMSSLIYDVDPDAFVMVCAAGRATTYLVTIAAALGLHIRVGMEDTTWLWPHRDDKVPSNVRMVEIAQSIAELLGRPVATPAEYRGMVGMPVVSGNLV
jgi:3-keto-5-aminohexanoate cleavage enzyme